MMGRLQKLCLPVAASALLAAVPPHFSMYEVQLSKSVGLKIKCFWSHVLHRCEQQIAHTHTHTHTHTHVVGCARSEWAQATPGAQPHAAQASGHAHTLH
eukprot:1144663-Pelagomonas_calceolata.AAC.3